MVLNHYQTSAYYMPCTFKSFEYQHAGTLIAYIEGINFLVNDGCHF